MTKKSSKRKRNESEQIENNEPAPLPAVRSSDEPLPKKVRLSIFSFIISYLKIIFSDKMGK